MIGLIPVSQIRPSLAKASRLRRQTKPASRKRGIPLPLSDFYSSRSCCLAFRPRVPASS